MIGGGGGSNIGDIVRNASTSGNPPLFFRAVVVEVLYDPESLTVDEKTVIKAKVTNPEMVDFAPPNTILARLITDGHDLTDSTASVIFPFFSSHFQFPVQPGEQVSVIYDDYARQGTSLGRWIARPHEGLQVEDANYTHADRRYDPALFATGTGTAAQARAINGTDGGSSTTTVPPGFPNGAGTQGTYTLQLSGNNTTNPYNQIVDNSQVTKFATFEAVPRWIKRPQEFVLQGMNNTLIMLGEDRVNTAFRVSGSNATDQAGYAGTIDVVCGRGRGGIPYDPAREPDTNDEKTRTSPLTITNTRSKVEVDKFPKRRTKVKNKTEGNPDFKRDAARVYVSMNTQGDKNFRTQHSTNTQEGFEYPENTVHPTQPPSQEGGIGLSYVVQKADHVRVIARRETDPDIKGTILLLREGVKDDDLAYLYLEQGKVQVEAKEIYFGKSTGKEEPYILWTVYNQHITELKAELKALADQVKEITTQYNNAFKLGNPYALTAALAIIGPAVQQTTTALVDTVIKPNLDQNIPGSDRSDAKSHKMFGE